MRKSVSTRSRFEIFKRDKFTCQYCGGTPPNVILHIDHIVPVCENGTNDSTNLITACSTCNQGKSGLPLDSVPTPLNEALTAEMERAEQLAEYNEMLKELKAIKDADFKLVSDALMTARGDDPEEFEIAGPWAESVRAILLRLPSQKILEAVQIADDKCNFKHNTYKAFKYFCGVCWRTIGRLEGTETR